MAKQERNRTESSTGLLGPDLCEGCAELEALLDKAMNIYLHEDVSSVEAVDAVLTGATCSDEHADDLAGYHGRAAMATLLEVRLAMGNWG